MDWGRLGRGEGRSGEGMWRYGGLKRSGMRKRKEGRGRDKRGGKGEGGREKGIGLGELCLKLYYSMPAIPGNITIMLPEESLFCSHCAQLCNDFNICQ